MRQDELTSATPKTLEARQGEGGAEAFEIASAQQDQATAFSEESPGFGFVSERANAAFAVVAERAFEGTQAVESDGFLRTGVSSDRQGDWSRRFLGIEPRHHEERAR